MCDSYNLCLHTLVTLTFVQRLNSPFTVCLHCLITHSFVCGRIPRWRPQEPNPDQGWRPVFEGYDRRGNLWSSRCHTSVTTPPLMVTLKGGSSIVWNCSADSSRRRAKLIITVFLMAKSKPAWTLSALILSPRSMAPSHDGSSSSSSSRIVSIKPWTSHSSVANSHTLILGRPFSSPSCGTGEELHTGQNSKPEPFPSALKAPELRPTCRMDVLILISLHDLK